MPDIHRWLAFLREFPRKNLGLKLMALAASVVLWWFVAAESSIQVGYVVPLEIRNLPEKMVITNKVERQVEVRLSGPASLIGSIRQEDLYAAIDMTGIKPGKERFRLTDRSINLPIGVHVQRIYPGTVEVALDRLERKKLPVVPRIEASARTRRRIVETRVEPAEVEVEALTGDFARIRFLSTEPIVPDVARGAYSTKARVELPVEHAKIVGTSTVQVTIRFAE